MLFEFLRDWKEILMFLEAPCLEATHALLLILALELVPGWAVWSPASLDALVVFARDILNHGFLNQGVKVLLQWVFDAFVWEQWAVFARWALDAIQQLIFASDLVVWSQTLVMDMMAAAKLLELFRTEADYAELVLLRFVFKFLLFSFHLVYNLLPNGLEILFNLVCYLFRLCKQLVPPQNSLIFIGLLDAR